MNSVTPALQHLSKRDFQRLAAFIHGTAGIKMPPSKQAMVEGRLRRRLRTLGIERFEDYCRFVFDEGGLEQETVPIIDAVTTNKTDFFREPEHFRILAGTVLPDLARRDGAGTRRPLKIWCSASSTGAEPYTLAMVVSEFGAQLANWRASILATDISTEVLHTAITAVYPEAMIAPVPMELRKRYLLRSRDRARAEVRIAPELRRLVQFGRLNLMETHYGVEDDMDVIFCRNVLIYFDKPTQQAILRRLCAHLRPSGYLFLGHSETVAGCDLPIRQVATTTFQKVGT
jgi:chemotaxis protein methyltransferase CheR